MDLEPSLLDCLAQAVKPNPTPETADEHASGSISLVDGTRFRSFTQGFVVHDRRNHPEFEMILALIRISHFRRDCQPQRRFVQCLAHQLVRNPLLEDIIIIHQIGAKRHSEELFYDQGGDQVSRVIRDAEYPLNGGAV